MKINPHLAAARAVSNPPVKKQKSPQNQSN